MKKFCDSLKEHAKNIILFEKEFMLQKICYFCGKWILEKFAQDKNRNIAIEKSEIIVIIQISIETQHIVFVI